MPSVQFLADMNVSPLTVRALVARGWNVVRVSDLLPRTAPDTDILQLARDTNRVIITQDLDFSALLALGGHNRPSLITLRLSTSDPQVIAEKLLWLLPQVEVRQAEGCAVTVDNRSIRIRLLPIR